MDSFGDGAHTIIAGASGLVGTELLEQLLSFQSIASVTALVRQPLEITNNKLIQIQDAQLRVTEWDESHADPDLGFICLGTTKKQAGSKQALAHVDIELVTQVAHTMKMLGVKRIAVISSYGASLRSLSTTYGAKAEWKETYLEWTLNESSLFALAPWQVSALPLGSMKLSLGE